MKDNIYCPLAFHGLYVERHPDTGYSISPCCLCEKSSNKTGLIDFNDTYLTEIRNKFRNGVKPDECRQCWDLEDNGGESKRLVYADQQQETYHDTLHYLDYNTMPICNARCVICSPKYSSTWANYLGVKSATNIVKNDYNYLKELDLREVKSIYFNGGEPLLTREHIMVLQQVGDLSAVDISYNTNGSCYPDDTAINIWNNCGSVTIFFSVDGIEDRFEETRPPLKWAAVSSNIEKINLLKNINIGCSYTIGMHNIFDLSDTINWFSGLPNFDVYTQFHVHHVTADHELYFNGISADDQILFLREMLKFIKFHWCASIINCLKNATI